MLKNIKVLKAVKHTEVTIKDMLYEEYFDKPGFYYPCSEYPPNGIGLPLTVDKHYDWLEAGMMEFVKEIPAAESRWWPITKKLYVAVISILKRERDAIDKAIEDYDELNLQDYGKEGN